MTALPRVPGEDLGWATPLAAFAIGCACAGTAVALVNTPPPVAHTPPAAVATVASPTMEATAGPTSPSSASSAPPAAASVISPASVCAPLAIVFHYAHEDLSAPEVERIDGVARWLVEHPDTTVVLQGHADARGSEDENLGLSKRRARNVANALAARGIDRRRMTASGFGSYQPIEGVPEENAANRRVVVFIKGASVCPSFAEKGKSK